MKDSTRADITGAVNIALMAVPTIYLLFYGSEYGFSKGLSAAIGCGTGLLFAILFSIVIGLIARKVTSRRNAICLKVAFAAGDLAEVERLMTERAIRNGVSESEIQEVTNTATADAEAEAQRIDKNIQLEISASEGALHELKK